MSVISTWELLLQMLGTCAARHSHTCALLFDGIFLSMLHMASLEKRHYSVLSPMVWEKQLRVPSLVYNQEKIWHCRSAILNYDLLWSVILWFNSLWSLHLLEAMAKKPSTVLLLVTSFLMVWIAGVAQASAATQPSSNSKHPKNLHKKGKIQTTHYYCYTFLHHAF